jgi:putative pre-16S rRNA nuclease
VRVLALDFGSKRIGLAISDPLGLTAQPLTMISKSETLEEDIVVLNKVISQYDKIDELLVGLPKTMAGAIGSQAEKVLVFVELLKQKLTIPVKTWDERLTTVVAERDLIAAGVSRKKRKKVVDQTAATFILQNYLDSK